MQETKQPRAKQPCTQQPGAKQPVPPHRNQKQRHAAVKRTATKHTTRAQQPGVKERASERESERERERERDACAAQLPTQPACSTPLCTIERFFAGAAEQHGKTAAPPANARPSPRSQDALSRRYTPPVERRAHQHMAEQTSARHTRCTLAPSTPPPPRRWSKAPTTPRAAAPPHPHSARAAAARTPTPTDRNPAMQGLDTAAPPPRSRRHIARPNARHPRPPDPGPRTPPLQRRLAPDRHRTAPRPRAAHRCYGQGHGSGPQAQSESGPGEQVPARMFES